ncbi:MAG: hypothetical protein ACON5J_19890 [Rubripirellula sp.]
MNSLLSDYGDYRPVHGSHRSRSCGLRGMQVDVFLFRHGLRRILGFSGPLQGNLAGKKVLSSYKEPELGGITANIFLFQ